MKILIPAALALIGIGGGIGAGFMLRPAPEADPAAQLRETNEAADAAAQRDMTAKEQDETPSQAEKEYVKLNNQFIIPVVSDDRISAMVVMSLSVEVESGKADVIYTSEPKLRDAFLQLLFDHANRGGFAGAFTSAANMDVLRMSLTEVAQSLVGPVVSGILVTDIARQDV